MKSTNHDLKADAEDPAAVARAVEQTREMFAAYDIRMMFRRYLERGFVAQDGDAAILTKLLGHEPRTYEDFASETMREWQTLSNTRAAA